MVSYTTRSGQNIFDVVNLTVNSLDSTYQLLLDNPGITKISNVPSGLTVQYTQPAIQPPVVNSSAPAITITKKDYLSRMNQSVYDVSLMTYGELDSLYTLIQDSNFSNSQTYPAPNTLFIFNPQKIKDNIFKDYMGRNGLVINTRTDFNSLSDLWILRTGFWDDSGVWIDTDFWID